MEGLTRLVAESMARHGIDVYVDHRRLQWSKWARCESSLDLLPVPSKPGLFALAEELIGPREIPMTAGKRMLAIFQIGESADLGIAMLRLSAPGTPLTARLAEGRVFVRYSVIEDDAQRSSAHQAFQRWLSASAEAASGIMSEPDAQLSIPIAPKNAKEAADIKPSSSNFKSEAGRPAPLPAGF